MLVMFVGFMDSTARVDVYTDVRSNYSKYIYSVAFTCVTFFGGKIAFKSRFPTPQSLFLPNIIMQYCYFCLSKISRSLRTVSKFTE